ncbi:MAG: hypothetical protein K9N47_26975 [Prosthecobacter sp.]|uniref:alpha/beta fold hydrolase n=1 Tax=Prosthecobacter sp. TaxID=1965333 RepID=UPI00261752C4|nr:hypothetical protein [Prosthecobacter sp.]MCF7789795.1 hypothetical protein [Prosthecobacter sp.]
MHHLLHLRVRGLGLLAAALALGAHVSSCTCAHKCASGQSTSSAQQTAAVAGYHATTPRPGEDLPWEMHDTRTSGPPVLLLHDILGPRPACLALGRQISALPQHYRVYVPVLYGQLGCESKSSFISSLFVNRPGWDFRAKNQDQPALPDLQRLCAALSARHNGRRVIVIGNCATGGIAVALLGSPHVCGAIISQPALPYSFNTSGRRSLDVSPATLQQAVRRSATLPEPALLGFRFYRDPVCTEHRFERLRSEFGSSFASVELCDFRRHEQDKLPASARAIRTANSKEHTVLIPKEGKPQPAHHLEVFAQVKKFLAQHSEE